MSLTHLRLTAVICLCATAACSDASHVPVAHDLNAEQAFVSMRVQADLWDVSSENRIKIASKAVQIQSVPYPEAGLVAALREDSDAPGRVRVRHFKDARGKLHSIGARLDGSGKPPEFVYAFENGRIRAVVSAKHERRQGKWFKVRSRITMFDSVGVPSLQVDLGPEGHRSAATGGRPSVPTDALKRLGTFLLPAELHAATPMEEGPCFSEWLTYSATSLVVAGASVTLAAAVAACASTRTGCTALDKPATIWLGAVATWNVSLDKLAACLLKADLDAENRTLGGRVSSSDGGATPSYEEELLRTKRTVEDFIADAVASGHFYCTTSGNYCVYYAA
jgi:hypothetical protein